MHTYTRARAHIPAMFSSLIGDPSVFISPDNFFKSGYAPTIQQSTWLTNRKPATTTDGDVTLGCVAMAIPA